MCKLKLMDYLRQSGKVFVQEQGTLSDKTYEKVLGAKSVIENAIGKTSLRVDICDANIQPNPSYYINTPNNVRVIVQDLLNDQNRYVEEFVDVIEPDKPFVRKIYDMIDKIIGDTELPIDKMKRKIKNRRKKKKKYGDAYLSGEIFKKSFYEK